MCQLMETKSSALENTEVLTLGASKNMALEKLEYWTGKEHVTKHVIKFLKLNVLESIII